MTLLNIFITDKIILNIRTKIMFLPQKERLYMIGNYYTWLCFELIIEE